MKKGVFGATGRTPLSVGQRRIMEEERERVVGKYREMKEARAGKRDVRVDGEEKGEGSGSGKRRRGGEVTELEQERSGSEKRTRVWEV